MKPIVFREAGRGDLKFVVDAWCRSYLNSFSSGFIQVGDWFEIMIPQVEKALQRPDVRVTLACLADEEPPADIAGFVVADVVEDPALIYYVFVKNHYRRARRLGLASGIASQLLHAIGVDPEKPFNYVCQTLTALQLKFHGKTPLAKWTPMMGRYPKSERAK